MNRKADLNIEPDDLPDLIALVLLILATSLALNAGNKTSALIIVVMAGIFFGRKYHFARKKGEYMALLVMITIIFIAGLLLTGQYLSRTSTVLFFAAGFFISWFVHDKFPTYVE